MKVLMISTDRGLFDKDSNVSKRFLHYAQLFDSLEVIVFSKRQKDVPKTIALTDNVTIYPTHSRSKFHYMYDAVRIAVHLSCDVISSQDPFETGMVALLISRQTGSMLHMQVHTDFMSSAFRKKSMLNRIRVSMAKKILPYADHIRVVSERIKQSLRKLSLKTEPEVLPILVQKQQSEQKATTPFALNILTVGRLEKEKNIATIIDAFARLQYQYPESGLLIAGTGRLQKKLTERVRRYGLEEKVLFLGHVQNLAEYYAIADVYVQASSYEGYGMTLVEAALHGLPIITTPVGIVGDVLIDGGSCLTTRSTMNDIRLKLEKVLSDDILRENLGARAQENAEDHVVTEEVYLAAFRNMFTLQQ